MSKRPITDDFLNLMLETKTDAGVDPCELHRLIYRFADEEPQHEAGVTIGFLTVADIPQALREQFVMELVALAAAAAATVESAPPAPVHPRAKRLSAAGLWRRTAAVLRPANPVAA